MKPWSYYTRYIQKQPGRNGCWVWVGTRTRDTYGAINIYRRGQKAIIRAAHRISWEMHNGPIPDGLWVLHKCDNRPCVRPSHLFLGTHRDNVRDAVSKGRFPHSEGHWAARLTAEKVRQARALRSQGWIVRDIAKEVGATHKAVSSALTGRTWRHVA